MKKTRTEILSPRRMPKTVAYRAVACLIFAGTTLHVPQARGEPCQNQAAIDVCKFGCNATGAVCGALCGAAVDVCTGACIGGCATTCTIDCCAGFCTDSDACTSCIGGCQRTCRNGCQLECDDCIFDCNRDCESICVPFRKVGEFCTPLFDRCADPLTCWPLPFPGEARPRCFPPESDNIFPDDVCRSFYSSATHSAAIAKGLTNSFGIGASAGAVVGGGYEEGVVYGADGRYGCYFTTCIGGLTDVSFGSYAGIGFYIDYDSFYGNSVVIIETVGKGINFSTAQVLATDGSLIGTTDALSLGLGILPADVGVYYCTTIVDTVGTQRTDGTLAPVTNSRPLALCKADHTVCANTETCDAVVNIDDGSYDVDGDAITLTQAPAGPYDIGENLITLTARDPGGLTHNCTTNVTVKDCDPPTIKCPKPLIVRCENSNGTTFIEPPAAKVHDCSNVVVTTPDAELFHLGTTVVTYTAVDELGMESACDLEITIDEPDTDGDGVVDCMDPCPTTQVFSPTGCGSDEEPADSDGDGVFDVFDDCPNTATGTEVDADGCPVEPPAPIDGDGDGVTDDVDLCTDTPAGTAVDADGCPIEPSPEQPLPDSDGDGVADDNDACPGTPDGTIVNVRGCPINEPPADDLDSDGDGIVDAADECMNTPAGTAVDESGCAVEQPPARPSTGHGVLRLPCAPLNAATLMLTLLGLTALRKQSVGGRKGLRG